MITMMMLLPMMLLMMIAATAEDVVDDDDDDDDDDDAFVGEDDSTLSRDYYRASWWIMVLSAIFCLFGSIAFARALHEDPPLRPMFASYYHIQNDELLGSWLYLLSVLCFIPYSLIFLKEAGFNSYVFAFMVLMAILASFVCFMFVLACYPSEAHVV